MTLPPTLQSPLLAAIPGIRHGFFTRQGGVSTGVYASLNVGLGSGDDPAAVIENRRLAAAAMDAPAEALITCYQIHSAKVRVARAPWERDRPEGDGVVTDQAGLLCGALAADCAPILLADGEARVVAAVHAGWRGALTGVIEAAVASALDLGATPANLVAAVGPCIGPSSYEVGLDFLSTFVTQAQDYERFFSPGARPDKRQFDLPAFVLHRLVQAGVGRCAWTGHDTCAEADAFFSNRRALHRGESDYGRLLSVITLV